MMRTSTEHPAPAPAKQSYLFEVQGLRTVAALMVAIYHIWFSRVSGGVDVFFVVAAYFATGSLLAMGTEDSVRGAAKSGIAYLLKTIRRIVPSMAVVLSVTTALIFVCMPHSMWKMQMPHLLASVFSVENFNLARLSSEYLARGTGTSPFQQFWALSLQVQFYFFWPVLAFLCFVIAAKTQLPFRRTLALVIGVLTALSFVVAVIMVRNDQTTAYYIPPTRVWEFGIGALLAIALRSIPPARLVSLLPWRPLGWVALVGLVSFAAVMNVSSLFPGTAALVPVAISGTLIVTSFVGAGPSILRWAPFQFLAPSSFAFYLWHWPLLVFYLYQHPEDQHVGILPGICIIAVAIVLGYLTTRFVEIPFRQSPRVAKSFSRTAIASAIAVVPVAILAGAWFLLYRQEMEQAKVQMAEFQQRGNTASDFVPAPVFAREDLPQGYRDGCHQDIQGGKVVSCVYGDRNAARTIALVGGSHSQQWLPAFDDFGREHSVRVVVATKSACVPGGSSSDSSVDSSCDLWSDDLLRQLVREKPDVVAMIATRVVDNAEFVPDGYRYWFHTLGEAGITVLGIRDNPWLDTDGPSCLEVHHDSVDTCGIERERAYPPGFEFPHVAYPNVVFADLSDHFCGAKICPVVDGQILRYRDRHHLTAAYVSTLADAVSEYIEQALNRTGGSTEAK